MQSTGVAAVTAFTAHREWASRPPDERFASVSSLYEAARIRRERTEERIIETSQIRTEAPTDDALALRGPSGERLVASRLASSTRCAAAAPVPRTLPASTRQARSTTGCSGSNATGISSSWIAPNRTVRRHLSGCARVHHDDWQHECSTSWAITRVAAAARYGRRLWR
jgi:hypothetical protein